MTTVTSRYLSNKQLLTLNKIGDIIIPANGDFPAFSTTGCIIYIDEMLSVTHPDDIKDFQWLMKLLRFWPRPLIKGLLTLTDKSEQLPNIIAKPMRLLNIGLKGIIFNLYYSNLTNPSYQGKKIHDIIQYHVQCIPDEKPTMIN